ncbi:NAD-dependent epimerase/dehydratase family protein [Sphingomonas solaris]|uniref:NAD-dependent epimerase/dehydratase family protein n=1 Tax=Alterirhizorhabdus solaris TaxID=2529389 RepID=A0A558QX67_9SPHN|nr:NAD-dependent epimerase/dehydratase family protein [Sphingomonas solaris]TVV71662.1 NAD-dependent epimerase/dehydratase family protein [Sphingomonas solaris]
MTILVTGAAGFIGFHVANRLLARGERVLGIDSLNDYYSVPLKRDRLAAIAAAHGDASRFVQVDFADHVALEAALAGEPIERIVHLGAQAGVRHSIEHPRDYVQANLVGHLNMLEVARGRGVPMVYASSSSVYGGNETSPFRVEDRVDRPLSLYAATKKADELMSETYAHLYRLPLTGLRFFTVYGPWGRPDMAMWLFTDAILHGRPITVFNGGDMRRDFTYVDDIVSGIVAALDNPPPDDGTEKAGGSRSPHRLYNIGNNRSEELGRLIEIVEAACGRPAIRDYRPMQPGDVKETYADIGAIQRDLGFAPTTTIAEGVPRFVAWFRSYHGV